MAYLLFVPICISCTVGDGQHTAITIAELRSYLQPIAPIGTYAGFNTQTHVLYIGNHLIDRRIHLNEESHEIRTIRYTYKPSGQNYVDLPSEEFRFRIGEVVFSGDSSLLTYNSHQILQKISGTKKLSIQFTHTPSGSANPIFHLWGHYEIYPDLPLIYKWLTIQNLTDSALYLEDIAVESLSFFTRRIKGLQIWRCETLGDRKGAQPPPWQGGAANAFVLVQDTSINGGVVLGNESTGFLKH